MKNKLFLSLVIGLICFAIYDVMRIRKHNRQAQAERERVDSVIWDALAGDK